MTDTVTITKEEADVYKRAMALLGDMSSNAEARPLIEKATKLVRPDVETTQERLTKDTAPLLEPIQSALEKITARFAAEDEARAKREEEQIEADLASQFADLRTNRNYTDEGIEAVKRLMVDKKIADAHAAAAYFESLNPPAREIETAWTPKAWNPNSVAGSEDYFNELLADEDGAADRMAARVLNEIRVG